MMPRGAAAVLLVCIVLLHPVPSPSLATGRPAEFVPLAHLMGSPGKAQGRVLGLFIPPSLGSHAHTLAVSMGMGGRAARCSAAAWAAWSVFRRESPTTLRPARLTMAMDQCSPKPQRRTDPSPKFDAQGQEDAGKAGPLPAPDTQQTADAGRTQAPFPRQGESQTTKSVWVVKRAGTFQQPAAGNGTVARRGLGASASTSTSDSEKTISQPAQGENVTSANSMQTELQAPLEEAPLEEAPLELKRPVPRPRGQTGAQDSGRGQRGGVSMRVESSSASGNQPINREAGRGSSPRARDGGGRRNQFQNIARGDARGALDASLPSPGAGPSSSAAEDSTGGYSERDGNGEAAAAEEEDEGRGGSVQSQMSACASFGKRPSSGAKLS